MGKSYITSSIFFFLISVKVFLISEKKIGNDTSEVKIENCSVLDYIVQ